MVKFLRLSDIDAYRRSYKLSNEVWRIVDKWRPFEKNTIGSQYTRAVDSVSANIAEGFGRHFKKDKVNFYRMSRGSVLESLDWTQKAKERKLLVADEYKEVIQQLKLLPKDINQLINYTNQKLKQ